MKKAHILLQITVFCSISLWNDLSVRVVTYDWTVVFFGWNQRKTSRINMFVFLKPKETEEAEQNHYKQRDIVAYSCVATSVKEVKHTQFNIKLMLLQLSLDTLFWAHTAISPDITSTSGKTKRCCCGRIPPNSKTFAFTSATVQERVASNCKPQFSKK